MCGLPNLGVYQKTFFILYLFWTLRTPLKLFILTPKISSQPQKKICGEVLVNFKLKFEIFRMLAYGVAVNVLTADANFFYSKNGFREENKSQKAVLYQTFFNIDLG